jgi:hypothetical protein
MSTGRDKDSTSSAERGAGHHSGTHIPGCGARRIPAPVGLRPSEPSHRSNLPGHHAQLPQLKVSGLLLPNVLHTARVPFLRAQVGRSTKLGLLLDASLCVLLSLTTHKTRLSALVLSAAFGCSLLLSGALGRCGTGIGMRAILRLLTVSNLRRIARCLNFICLWS